jgi:hypothetical protein
VQLPVNCEPVQVRPQPPQLLGLESTDTSQPFDASPSQLAKPARHVVMLQSPEEQTPNPFVIVQFVPSGCAAPEQVPVASSHIPAPRQAVAVPHSISEPPQVPARQRSPLVHSSPSSHAPFSLMGAASQRPAAELQVGRSWQDRSVWAAEQSRGVPSQLPTDEQTPSTKQKSAGVQGWRKLTAT